jgi:GNAT superfamily N-acetyltransferase
MATSPAVILPPNYPADLARDVLSEDGLHYSLRPVRPDDAERLVEFHNHLSPHSCYLRFFTFHPTLSTKEVEHFTCVDYVDRLALVAEIDGTVIAVARFDRHEGTSEAEVAFVVADEYQHHGIGSLLLDELVLAAGERGITTFLADTLSENHTMLGVFLHAGFEVKAHNEYGTIYLRFKITPSEEYRQAKVARGQSCQIKPSCPLIEAPTAGGPGHEAVRAAKRARDRSLDMLEMERLTGGRSR